MPRPFGFNVIGHVSGNLGLGVTARIIVQVLLDNGFPVSVFDIDPGIGRGRRDLRFESLEVSDPAQLPYGLNLAILPPPTLALVVSRHGAAFADPEFLNVAFTIWELPVVPDAWRPTLEFFDALVAQSGFIRQTLANALTPPTLPARHALYLPPNVVPDRARFGLAEDDVAYVTSLELASDPIRKNVLGVIDAFGRGLADFGNARLLIRLNNADSISPGNRTLRALLDAAGRDARIRLLTEPLDYPSVLSLYASSDVFVSLHRSEGLGLGPMEAMALGRAVVATGWSGNMEYMDHTTACLVPYKMVPALGTKGGPYSPTLVGDAKWADPDIDAAALWMRRLAEDTPLRKSIGERAKTSIGRFHQTALEGRFAYELKALWEHRLYTAQLPSLERRLRALKTASRMAMTAQEREPGRLGKLGHAAVQGIDRHLLWRFRRT